MCVRIYGYILGYNILFFCYIMRCDILVCFGKDLVSKNYVLKVF